MFAHTQCRDLGLCQLNLTGPGRRTGAVALGQITYSAFSQSVLRVLPLKIIPLSKKTQGDAWFKPSEDNFSAGVCLRVEAGHFPPERCSPSVLATVSEDADTTYIDSDTRIQILDTMNYLPGTEKEQWRVFETDRALPGGTNTSSSSGQTTSTPSSDFEEKCMKLVRSSAFRLSAAFPVCGLPSWWLLKFITLTLVK
ncbi:hypothetical protein C8F04DRAFT_1180764 [Mycena alexandri]|uniref:Uncharacterized protein n=1 Tax=Mycena alexandri TaxID=1745969 RepID=A0AAD6T0S3_9AGAR|nr:hypothetical protein C8F04DRAFT_1180764 [Mycena alexandri]